MVYRYETFRDDKGIVVLQSLKVSHLSIISNRFYESSKSKNWMCELCTFSQIRSHIYTTIVATVSVKTLHVGIFYNYIVSCKGMLNTHSYIYFSIALHQNGAGSDEAIQVSDNTFIDGTKIMDKDQARFSGC